MMLIMDAMLIRNSGLRPNGRMTGNRYLQPVVMAGNHLTIQNPPSLPARSECTGLLPGCQIGQKNGCVINGNTCFLTRRHRIGKLELLFLLGIGQNTLHHDLRLRFRIQRRLSQTS